MAPVQTIAAFVLGVFFMLLDRDAKAAANRRAPSPSLLERELDRLLEQRAARLLTAREYALAKAALKRRHTRQAVR